MNLIRVLTVVAHAVLSAALFGGAFYSITTVQPRAKAFFKDVRDYESLVANLAHGARWQLLAVLSFIGITGFVDPLLSALAHPLVWWICFCAKSVLWASILCCFVYVSWYLWPRRILAASSDLPGIHKQFAVIGRTVLSLLFVAFVIGLVMDRFR